MREKEGGSTTNTFDEIYLSHHEYVRRFLLRLCNYNEHIADDLTQETFFQAYKSIHRFQGDCRIETWICSIAQNVFCAFLREEKRQKRLVNTQILNAGSSYYIQEEGQLVSDIAIVLSRFPSQVASVLSYRLFSELTFSEISTLLSISENSAKVIYHRGRLKLKTILKKEYGYEI